MWRCGINVENDGKSKKRDGNSEKSSEYSGKLLNIYSRGSLNLTFSRTPRRLINNGSSFIFMFYRDLARRKEIVRNLIRNNPKATYQYIKQKSAIKIERVYKGRMEEAFRDAGVEPPRSFKRKTIEERRAILIDYIQKHPRAGGQTIAKDTKIPVCGVFKTTKEAFDAAGVPYPRDVDRLSRLEKKEDIILYIKEYPLTTQIELQKIFHVQLYRYFKSMNEIYKKARIKPVTRSNRGSKNGTNKRGMKKQNRIIEFIKNNPCATQREINKQCNTRVQELFKNGILGAYEKAGIPYPTERLQIYGIAKKEIKRRSERYEDNIASCLSQFGKVSRRVKTKRGIIDAVLEKKRKKAIIEIKDYRSHQICRSEIKQLHKYLEACDHPLGILICPKKPKRDAFVIGDKKIFIVEDKHLNDVHYFMNKYG